MTPEERFARIEQVLDRIGNTQLKLDSAFATLADSHVKTREDIDRLIQQGIAQSERIDQLLSEIAKFVNL